MKIICLNTWGGRAGHLELLSFFEREKETTDVFCLQEMWRAPYDHLDGKAVGGVPMDVSKAMSDGVQRVSNLLPEYELYFHPHNGDHYGLTMFVKKASLYMKLEIFLLIKKGGMLFLMEMIREHALVIYSM